MTAPTGTAKKTACTPCSRPTPKEESSRPSSSRLPTTGCVWFDVYIDRIFVLLCCSVPFPMASNLFTILGSILHATVFRRMDSKCTRIFYNCKDAHHGLWLRSMLSKPCSRTDLPCFLLLHHLCKAIMERVRGGETRTFCPSPLAKYPT